MTDFIPCGPFDIPVYKGVSGRAITDDNACQFWKKNSEFSSAIGCYIFAIRAGGGYKPIYVGKATKGFKQEAFHSHKLSKYQQAMVDIVRGTPVMFFIKYPNKKGKNNNTHIARLEKFLIQTAVLINPDLMNVQGIKAEAWTIKGVIRASGGQPTKSAKELRKILKM